MYISIQASGFFHHLTTAFINAYQAWLVHSYNTVKAWQLVEYPYRFTPYTGSLYQQAPFIKPAMRNVLLFNNPHGQHSAKNTLTTPAPQEEGLRWNLISFNM